MQVGARCTNKARLQSLILTADEFSRRGAGEGTKKEEPGPEEVTWKKYWNIFHSFHPEEVLVMDEQVCN